MNTSLTGFAPAIHQVYVTKFLHGLMLRFSKNKKFNKYIATVDTSLHLNSSYKLPDISVWNYLKMDYENTILAIEICLKNDIQEDLNKLNDLMLENINLKECFVFDYENKIFYKIYRKKTDSLPSKPFKKSYSDIFKIDLAKFI